MCSLENRILWVLRTTVRYRKLGLERHQIADAIVGTYRLLDRVDRTLTGDGVDPLCRIVELANLSSMIGNIFGAEIAKSSKGLYVRNRPHKYPDLLPVAEGAVRTGIEIKMALNRNQPKGHLAKPGHYITCRYVLTDSDGNAISEAVDRPKATHAAIWELRTGCLEMDHFNLSNTDGDSGENRCHQCRRHGRAKGHLCGPGASAWNAARRALRRL